MELAPKNSFTSHGALKNI